MAKYSFEFKKKVVKVSKDDIISAPITKLSRISSAFSIASSSVRCIGFNGEPQVHC